MTLTEDQAQYFYALWLPLLSYANSKYHIAENIYGNTFSLTSYTSAIKRMASKIWENRDIIEEYIDSGCTQLTPEDIQTIRSWKRAISGRFIVERHLKNGSVLISLDGEEVYMVKGLYSSWREMLGNDSKPRMVKATILPFEGVIINDGVIDLMGVNIGSDIARQFAVFYRRAKDNNTIHFSL